jgi:nucleoid-associated protein YgaU
MGLFSFISNAGKKIFGGDDAPAPKTAEESADFAVELKSQIKSLGLSVQSLGIRYTDGTVTVRGEAADQATREKIILAVGNTQGVSQVDDQMTVTPPPAAVEDDFVGPPAPQSTFYTVVSGDTLGKIAAAHYGVPAMYGAIFEANKPMLSHPDRIYPGQVLRIPAVTGPVTHTVVAGDTLGGISKRWLGSAGRYMEIYEANKQQLRSPDAISVGQVLVIPVNDPGAVA